MINNIKGGIISLLDLPVGNGLKEFLATPLGGATRSYAVTYEEAAETSKNLNKRAEISGEGKADTAEMINRAGDDIGFIDQNKDIFKKILLTKFTSGDKFQRFIEDLAKSIIYMFS